MRPALQCAFALGGLLALAGAAQAVVPLASFEGGIAPATQFDNVNILAPSNLHATDGTGSLLLTLNDPGGWSGWHWVSMTFSGTTPADVAANQYLMFDAYIENNQAKLGGMGGNSAAAGGWTQQDFWGTPASTPTPVTDNTYLLPLYPNANSAGLGTMNPGQYSFAWDYKTRGFDPTGSSWVQFNVVFQGPTGTNVYLDNFRLTNAVPEPASLSLLAPLGLLALRRRQSA